MAVYVQGAAPLALRVGQAATPARALDGLAQDGTGLGLNLLVRWLVRHGGFAGGAASQQCAGQKWAEVP